MKFFDIGANLTNSRFASDLDEVLANAKNVGVEAILITGTNESESAAALAITERDPIALFSTAGVHPHDADQVSADWLSHLSKLLRSPQVVAVGECGLDFNRNFSSREGQLAVFEAQIALAKEHNLPLFLHERDAFDEQIQLLTAYQVSEGVAHCFTGTKEQMRAYLDLGLYIGITGWLCDPKRGETLREAVQELPLNRLLLETDAPYLTPRSLPKKIRRNEPQYIVEVAKTLSEITGHSIDAIAQASSANARALFNIGAN